MIFHFDLFYVTESVILTRYKFETSSKHFEYDLLRPDDQPSVSQMAEVAVNKLKKNPIGFYLFVE